MSTVYVKSTTCITEHMHRGFVVSSSVLAKGPKRSICFRLTHLPQSTAQARLGNNTAGTSSGMVPNIDYFSLGSIKNEPPKNKMHLLNILIES